MNRIYPLIQKENVFYQLLLQVKCLEGNKEEREKEDRGREPFVVLSEEEKER